MWQVERAGTHLVLGQGFQVLQDLSHHRLTELAVLSQELGVSPVQAVIGVNWFNKQEQHVTWDWQMAGRPGREYGNGQGDPLTLGFTKKTPSLGPSLGLRPTVWKSSSPHWPCLEGTATITVTHSPQLPGTVASTHSVSCKDPHNEHQEELACTSSVRGETEAPKLA